MATRPNEITKKPGEYIEELASAALSTLPFAGGLAKYLDTYYPTQFKATLEEFRRTLLAHANEIESVVCNTDQLQALVTEATFQSARTASEVKREAFRAIILNYASGKAAADHKVEMFTHVVADLTELELRMLRVAFSPAPALREANLLNQDGKAIRTSDNITIEQVIPTSQVPLSRLAYHNLLRLGLLTQKATLPGPENQPVTLWFLVVSELGRELLDWITAPSEA